MERQVAERRIVAIVGQGDLGVTQEILRTIVIEDLKRKISLYRAVICETKRELEALKYVRNREKDVMADVLMDAAKIFDRFSEGTEEAGMSARIGAVLAEVGR